MKAIILAAGFGTRLSSVTTTPKPLIKVNGISIVERLIKKVKDLGINDITITTNKRDHSLFVDTLKSISGVKIIHNEVEKVEDKLGALGDFKFVLEKESIEDDVLLMGGDNLIKDSLKEAHSLFKSNNKDLLIFHDIKDKEKAKRFGIALLDKNKKIINFEEKPQIPKSTLCSTSIYFFKKNSLNLLDSYLKENNADNLGDFIPYLIQNIGAYGYVTKEDWIDIGTKEALEQAKDLF